MANQKAWSPKVTRRQAHLINLKKRYKLAHGPKKSGKTRGVEQAVCKHLWEEDRAIVGIFAKSIKSAAIAGSYKELTTVVIPEWIEGPLDFHYTVPPKVDGATRTHYFKTSNQHGTESECYLFSIDNEDEIDRKVKNLVFSMVWIIELDNFEDPNIFLATIQQLRQPTVPPERRQWIGDTNPAEEGEDSWIYRMFIDPQILDSEKQKPMLDEIGAVSFTIDDNPYLEEVEKQLLIATYSVDPYRYARYIEGKWVRDITKGIFKDRFDPDLHVVGHVNGDRSAWNVIVPTDGCTELLTGWDLGDKFHSFHLCEKVFLQESNCSTYAVLADLFTDNEEVSIADFAVSAWEIMERYSKFIKDTQGREVFFRNWSDNSAQYNYSAAADSTDENIVAKSTGNRVRLMAAPKGSGSVRRRINTMKRLLADGRLIVSANCFGTIEMFRFLRKPPSGNKAILHDKFSHRFDSLSYLIDSEEPIEIINTLEPTPSGVGLVSITSGWT